MSSGPVLSHPPGQLAQEMTGQMLHLDPGQQKKAAVISDPAQRRAPGRCAPADKSISIGAMPGGRSDQMHGHIPSGLVFDQVEQMTSDRSITAQVVIAPQV